MCISPIWKDKLYRYITGIIQQNNHKLLAINGMPDHLHILFGMRPAQSLSELMQDVKRESSAWINNNKLVPGTFAWQPGYGAFSYAKSELPRIIAYIENQEKHHAIKTFNEEYINLLKEFNVQYEEKYLFQFSDQ